MSKHSTLFIRLQIDDLTICQWIKWKKQPKCEYLYSRNWIIFIKQNRCYCFVFSKQFSNKFFSDEQKKNDNEPVVDERIDAHKHTFNIVISLCFFVFPFTRAHLFLYHIQSGAFLLYIEYSIERYLFFCHSHYGRVEKTECYGSMNTSQISKANILLKCVYFNANSDQTMERYFLMCAIYVKVLFRNV